MLTACSIQTDSNQWAGVFSKGIPNMCSLWFRKNRPRVPQMGETWLYSRGPAEPTDMLVWSVLGFKTA